MWKQFPNPVFHNLDVLYKAIKLPASPNPFKSKCPELPPVSQEVLCFLPCGSSHTSSTHSAKSFKNLSGPFSQDQLNKNPVPPTFLQKCDF